MAAINNRRFLLKFLLILVVLTACTPKAKPTPPAQPTATPQEPAIISNQPVCFANTGDLRALGYPDSRKIVRDSQGNLYVAYRRTYATQANEDGVYHIFVAKSKDNGQTWQEVNDGQPIETVGDYLQRVPSIAIDQQDTLHVVWYGLDAKTGEEPNNRQIKYTRSKDGGDTWDKWRNLAFVPGYTADSELWQEHPVIYAAPDKYLYIAWQGRTSQNKLSQIILMRSKGGGKDWNDWHIIGESQQYAYSRPTLLTTHDGKIVYLIMYGGDDNGRWIWWAQSTDHGDTWTPWQAVAQGKQDQRHLSAAIDNQDHIHLVWRQQPEGSKSTDTPTQIYYSMFDGKGWSKPVRPAPQNDQFQLFPSLTVDTDNEPWLVWMQTPTVELPKEDPNDGEASITTLRAGRWQPPRPLSGATTALYPNLRRDLPSANTQIDALWLEPTDKGYHFCYRSFDPEADWP